MTRTRGRICLHSNPVVGLVLVLALFVLSFAWLSPTIYLVDHMRKAESHSVFLGVGGLLTLAVNIYLVTRLFRFLAEKFTLVLTALGVISTAGSAGFMYWSGYGGSIADPVWFGFWIVVGGIAGGVLFWFIELYFADELD